MGRARSNRAQAQPEKHASLGAEPLQIRVPGRAVLAVVVMPIDDAQGRKRLAVESN
ncbi:hypothetical protein D3C78_1952980 [compost metagenome]